MKRTSILLAVLAGAVVLAAVVAPRPDATVAAETAQKSTPEKPLSAAEKKAQQEKVFGPDTIVAAQRAVQASLKDPDSAKFENVYANYTDGYGLVACGRVNAKNSVGGYTGFKRFVSGGKSVILEGRDNLADAWAKAC